LTPIGFRVGQSFLHSLDARFKLICLVLLSLSCVDAPFWAMAVLSAAATILLIQAGAGMGSLIRELRYFLVLLLVVWISRGLSTPGTTLVRLGGLGLTQEGLAEGAIIGWRLLLVVMMGVLMIITTRPAHIRAAVAQLLAPLPGIAGHKLATMMGLIVRFIPVILDHAHLVSEAQQARCVHLRRNPLYRIPYLVVPLMRRTFLHADTLCDAMEARCYHPQGGLDRLSAQTRDWVALFCVVGFCALLFIA